MKKPILFFLLIFLVSFSDPIHSQVELGKHAAAAKVVFLDHGTINDIDSLEVTNGLEISYLRSISSWAKIGIPLKISVADLAGQINKRTLVSLDATVQFPFFRSTKRINPYFFGGVGFVLENFDESNIQFPVGLGLNFFLGGQSFISFQAEYRKATVEKRDNLQFGIGYLFHIVKMEETPDKEDRDGDGVSDHLDKCPDEAGNPIASGCPDRDNDGITDLNDSCPDEAGTENTAGCPDSDEDSVADKYDECPNEKGLPAKKGCPEKDADGDGVSDEEDECPAEAGAKITAGCPDSDGDGVADKYDLCNGEIGKKYTSGCPDKDSDGIADKFDDCPDVAGPPERKGCPNSDTDKDGVPDSSDDCPTIAGPATSSGCPDSDGDGLHDGVDKCPTTAGAEKNGGCPEVAQEVKDLLALATSNVQFETGKATILEISYPVLVQIVEILKRYPDYKMRISGHTDNVGDDAKNQKLSEDRARACYDYFISKGVATERLSSAGYGETRPIAPNTTAEGRATNRRVEFELYLK